MRSGQQHFWRHFSIETMPMGEQRKPVSPTTNMAPPATRLAQTGGASRARSISSSFCGATGADMAGEAARRLGLF